MKRVRTSVARKPAPSGGPASTVTRNRGLNKGHETIKRNAREKRRVVLTILAHVDSFTGPEAELLVDAEHWRQGQWPLPPTWQSALTEAAKAMTWPPVQTYLNNYQWPRSSTISQILREFVAQGLLEVDKEQTPYTYMWVE